MSAAEAFQQTQDARPPAGQRLEVEQIAEEYLERRRYGERPSVDEYVRRHPELADEIRQLIPTLAMLEDCAPAGEELGAGTLSGDWLPLAEPLGEYRVIREIGRGGMGVVYEAEHETLRRRVALKVLPRDAATHRTSLARFLREARAAGQMHHSNIVPVFEVGIHKDRHFYAMQYIHGQNLDAVIEELRRLRHSASTSPGVDVTEPDAARIHPSDDLGRTVAGDLLTGQSTRSQEARAAERAADDAGNLTRAGEAGESYFQRVARIGLQVADALAYAHRHGILHRDIKPSNLILDTSGTVWVTDFGLAKHEGDNFTRTGDIVGTVRYMAPERLQGRCDARSDVYSLGLTLYELLTLRPALDGNDRASLLRLIETDSPPPPRQLAPHVPRDLETIVLKAIEKSPAHRYGSAAELAEDLRLFLADRPILARRSSWFEQSWRWCRRNPIPAVLASCVGVLLLMLVAGSLTLAAVTARHARRLAAETQRASRAEVQAVQAKKEAIRRLYEARLGQARAGRFSSRPGQHFDTLESVRQAAEILPSLDLGHDEEQRQRELLRNETIAALPLIDLRRSQRFEVLGSDPGTVALPPDYSIFAASDDEGNVTIRRVSDGVQLAQLPGPGHRAWHLVFSPDGRYLAGKFHRGDPEPTSPTVRVWDWKVGELLIEEHRGLNRARMAFRGDSGEFALGLAYPEVRRYHLPDGKIVHRHRNRADAADLCWHPAGTHIAVAHFDNHPIEILDCATGQSRPLNLNANVRSIAWSPDGRTLALGTFLGRIHLVHVEQSDRPVRRLDGHSNSVVQLCFNHAGDLLLSRSWDSTARLWLVATGKETLRLDDLPLRGTGFRQDDGQIALASGNTVFGIWDVAQGGPLRVLSGRGESRARASVRFHPARSDLLASATADGIELWDAQAGRRCNVLAAPHAVSAVFSPDGSGLLSGSSAGLQFWPIDMSSDSVNDVVVGPAETIRPPAAERIGLTMSAKYLALDCGLQEARVFDLNDFGSPRWTFEHRHLDHAIVSPDARWLVTTTWNGRGVVVWDLNEGKRVTDLAPEIGSATPAFSPDGRWLAVSDGFALYLWETGTWRRVYRIPRERPDGWPGPVTFSPDGRMLAVPFTRYVAQLIEPLSGRCLGILQTPTSVSLSDYGFSADNRHLAIAETEHIQLWDMDAVRRELREMDIGW